MNDQKSAEEHATSTIEVDVKDIVRHFTQINASLDKDELKQLVPATKSDRSDNNNKTSDNDREVVTKLASRLQEIAREYREYRTENKKTLAQKDQLIKDQQLKIDSLEQKVANRFVSKSSLQLIKDQQLEIDTLKQENAKKQAMINRYQQMIVKSFSVRSVHQRQTND